MTKIIKADVINLGNHINQLMRKADIGGGMSPIGRGPKLSPQQKMLERMLVKTLSGAPQQMISTEEERIIPSPKELTKGEQAALEQYVLDLWKQTDSREEQARLAVSFQATTQVSLPQLIVDQIARQEASVSGFTDPCQIGRDQPLLDPTKPFDGIILDYFRFMERAGREVSFVDLVAKELLTNFKGEIPELMLFEEGLAEAMRLQGAFNLKTLECGVLDPRLIASSSDPFAVMQRFYGEGNTHLQSLRSGLALEYSALVSFFRHMMKAELHQHTSGSVPAETIIKLGQQKQYIDWRPLEQKFGAGIGRIIMDGDVESLRRLIRYSKPGGNLEGYRQAMEIAQQVMDDESSIEKVAYDIAKLNYADGVRFLEVRFSPGKKNMSPSSVVYSVLRGLKAAQVEHPDLEAKMILILMKHLSADQGESMANDIQKWMRDPELADSIVGIDTAGEEIGYDARRHERAFRMAVGAGLVPVSHAGESFLSLEDGLKAIVDAMNIFKVRRVDHALALGLDPRMYAGRSDGYGVPYTDERVRKIIGMQETVAEMMTKRDIAITVCPTSNRDTGNLVSLDMHPILRFLELNLKVTVNTDDPVTSATSLTEEFVRIGLARTLSLLEIIELIKNGIDYRLSNLR